MFGYFKSLVQPHSGNSSKSFALLLSSIMGAVLVLCIGFILIYDVAVDGIIDTILTDLGWFLLSVGAYSLGSGAGKIATDFVSKRKEEESVG